MQEDSLNVPEKNQSGEQNMYGTYVIKKRQAPTKQNKVYIECSHYCQKNVLAKNKQPTGVCNDFLRDCCWLYTPKTRDLTAETALLSDE